jgi:hypothetical protein
MACRQKEHVDPNALGVGARPMATDGRGLVDKTKFVRCIVLIGGSKRLRFGSKSPAARKKLHFSLSLSSNIYIYIYFGFQSRKKNLSSYTWLIKFGPVAFIPH